ncbi:NADH dehydrogenase [ubiquinone] 1 alpha subcomplex subunit 12 isoform X2 [Dasypus novemcinctus]|uniref:NADH dehydrogenase [ubiquinone] 1 alpha subcomplex subunit 12 isoform X2 n=1 Tax=Dasypus novemcinctus TaxID=9361 RepID=UPI0039C91D95
MELAQVLKRGLQQLSGHGGLRGYLRVFFRANDVRVGKLVGEDKYGNKYYEDNKQFFGRHRWVIYTTEMNGKNTFWDMDGSMVPPEWRSQMQQLILHFRRDISTCPTPLTGHQEISLKWKAPVFCLIYLPSSLTQCLTSTVGFTA